MVSFWIVLDCHQAAVTTTTDHGLHTDAGTGLDHGLNEPLTFRCSLAIAG